MARRLVEAGVSCVEVVVDGWDTHDDNFNRVAKNCGELDPALAALLDDLARRGLLDSTLVTCFGEFGRTPRINDNVSRDHWPDCYTVMLAGGGVKRGFVHGASDKQGAYPAENAVRPEDLTATVYQLLGIDPHTEVRDVGNRPLPISNGNAIQGVIA